MRFVLDLKAQWRGLLLTILVLAAPELSLATADPCSVLLERLAQPLRTFARNLPENLDQVVVDRVLFSNDIGVLDLPYRTGLREPVTLVPAELHARAQVIEELQGVSLTPILIGSQKRMSVYGVVRLGYLANGRPIALKQMFYRSKHRKKMEAKGAKLLSDIGVFPLFHGTWTDPEGHVHLAMDIAPGEVSTIHSRFKLNGLSDLMSILDRLTRVGILRLPDGELQLQTIRSIRDRLILIDADGYYGEFLDGNRRLLHRSLGLDQPMFRWPAIMAYAIASSDSGAALTVLKKMKAGNGHLWKDTIALLKAAVDKNQEIPTFGVRLGPDVRAFVVAQ